MRNSTAVASDSHADSCPIYDLYVERSDWSESSQWSEMITG